MAKKTGKKKTAGRKTAGRKTAGRKTASRKTASSRTSKSRASASRAGGRKAAGRKGGAKKKGGGRRPNAAFLAPVTPSPALSEVVGDKPQPRTEITSRLWSYIKKNGLQDQTNRRMINADEKLKPVFGGKSSVNMFEMTKLVNRHLR